METCQSFKRWGVSTKRSILFLFFVKTPFRKITGLNRIRLHPTKNVWLELDQFEYFYIDQLLGPFCIFICQKIQVCQYTSTEYLR